MISAEDWAGSFGDDYIERADLDTTGRSHFWDALLERHDVRSVLEVGCGTGENLAEMKVPCAGVDVNPQALEFISDRIETMVASATDLPFVANLFDLVLTFGVLIHVPPSDLECAMREIVRVSRRFVFCGEYLGDEEVRYRGGSLWRRDYGLLYMDIGLKLIEHGALEGPPWDRGEVHWWLLSQPEVRDA